MFFSIQSSQLSFIAPVARIGCETFRLFFPKSPAGCSRQAAIFGALSCNTACVTFVLAERLLPAAFHKRLLLTESVRLCDNMPDAEPPGRQQGNHGGGSVPVVQSLGWTPRSAGRGPAPPARRPPPRMQHGPPQYPTDMPGVADGPPMLMQNFHGHHGRHSSSMLPMMPAPPPPPIPPADAVGAQDWPGPANRNAASSTAPPAWLTGTYGARGPVNGVGGDPADFRVISNGSSVRNSANGVGASVEKRHGVASETKPSLGGIGHDFPAAENHEAWCKKHIEAIEATSRGDAALPNVKKVMETLKFPVLNSHRESLRQIRKEKWATTERVRGAIQDLRKLEREFIRIDAHATHIDSKITRLRSYSEFIENDWQDKPEPVEEEGKANGDGSVHADGESKLEKTTGT